MNSLLRIIYVTSIFTVVIFFINYNFFWNIKNDIENKIIEEKYIEKEIDSNQKEEKNKIINKQIIKYYKNKIKTKYSFYYYPKKFENEIIELKNHLEDIIIRNIFSSKISSIDVILIKEKIDSRWKMKNKTIKLYWAKNDNISEYIAVFIHELGHYIDLYFLEKKVFLDISSKFYDISWRQTKIKKPNMKVKDFVSWYAMTNKYEDFAESFTYYILHNKDFFEKAQKNKTIKQKYDFFGTYIFKNKEFFYTKFNKLEKKDYYRDITKIKFEQNKLFNYLEKIKSSLY